MSEASQPKKPPKGGKEAQGSKGGGKGRRKSVPKNEPSIKEPVILQNPAKNGSRENTPNLAPKNRSNPRGSTVEEGHTNRHHHVEDGLYPNPWWRTLTQAELRCDTQQHTAQLRFVGP